MLGAGTVLRCTVEGTQNQNLCHSNGMVYGWYSHSRAFLELHSYHACYNISLPVNNTLSLSSSEGFTGMSGASFSHWHQKGINSSLMLI